MEKTNTSFYHIIVSAWFCLCSGYGIAGERYLIPGDSQVIQVKKDIDTVFISSPNVADYELIGDKGIIAYAKDEGRADLVVFDKEGGQIMKTTLVVNAMLSTIHQQIDQEYPESHVTIQKIGKTYVISGTVPTEEAKNRIYQIVGESVGAEKKVSLKKVKESSNDNSDSDSDNSSSWLDETEWKGIINRLELPLINQVNVKLSVVEVSREFIDNIGLDWGTITSGTITPGVFRFVRLNADTLSSMVHALSNDSVARVLAEPNLSVLSGETAEFLVGGEVPIVTTSQNGTNISYKEFGIKLNIGARVNSREKIRLLLGEEVSNIDSLYADKANNSFPALQTRRARTTVELADGESFILGGLISKNDREALSKIPVIGDVPILGALFRNASTQRSHKELMVVATVNLIKPISSGSIMLPNIQRTSTLARFFNIDGIAARRDRARAQEFIAQGGFIK